MNIADTMRLLWRWGRWARGNGAIGYPSTSSTEGINAGSRCTAPADPDPRIVRVDWIVRESEDWMRQILIVHHQNDGTLREKSARLKMPKTTYLRWLDDSRWYVHLTYDMEIVDKPDQRCY